MDVTSVRVINARRRGNVALISKDINVDDYFRAKVYQTQVSSWKKKGSMITESFLSPMYLKNENGDYLVLLGALKYLNKHSPFVNFTYLLPDEKVFPLKRKQLIPEGLEEYLSTHDYEWRSYQRECVDACLSDYSGLVQLPTGTGKSEVQFVLAHSQVEQVSGKVLIIEPTTILVEQVVDRLREKYKYSNINTYAEIRNSKVSEVSDIVVSTPFVIHNDIENGVNTDILSEFTTLIIDEGQVSDAKTWVDLCMSLSNLMYVYSMSAMPVEVDEEPSSFTKMTLHDATVFSVAGPRVFKRTPKDSDIRKYINVPYVIDYYIEWTSLDPKVDNNWTEIRNKILQYSDRITILSSIIDIVDYFGLSSLTTVDTKSYGESVFESVLANTKSKTFCWYGGNEIISNRQDVKSNKDAKTLFEKDELRHIIGTSHLYKGVDLPSLNVLLVSEGKKPIQLIQKVGRTTRKDELPTIVINIVDQSYKALYNQGKSRSSFICKTYGVSSTRCTSYKELYVAIKSILDAHKSSPDKGQLVLGI